MEQSKEIMELRNELESLKRVVESLAALVNEDLILELYKEHKDIEAGNYLTEEQFEKKHNIKIH
ncbi:MAG: hypothetical protein WDZ69_01070 [Candidatus Pacearchaeota archaeon]